MAKTKAKFRDFDVMLAEKRKDAPVLRIFGREYTLAATLRYDAVLALTAMNKRADGETVSEDEAFSTFALILGEDIVQELRVEREFTLDIAAEIVQWALQEYGIVQKDSESPKVAA